jgi:hypothetical protein
MCRSAMGHVRSPTHHEIGAANTEIGVIQAPERGPRIMRYELTDFEWTAIRPLLNSFSPEIAKRQLLCPARKRNLKTRPRQNNPTGKSLKPCPVLPRKIFHLTSDPNHRLIWLVSPDERGGSRSSRTRGGMRWTRKLRLTSVADAYGESVWF